MDYKNKLKQWNSTEKYRSEVSFLQRLIPLATIYYYNTLDYGAGRCETAKSMCADSFDVFDYREDDVFNYYLNELPDKDYDFIYFMHSFAHIPNPKEVLTNLRTKYPKAQITVITPNAYWLMLQSNKDYKPDPTVIQHYTQTQLKELFESAGYKVTLVGQFGEEKTGVNERIFLQAS